MFRLALSTVPIFRFTLRCLCATITLTAMAAPCCKAQTSSSQAPSAKEILASAPVPFADLSSLPPETRGDLLMFRGSYAAALDAYQQVWPKSAAVWNKIGLAYHHLYALDEAMRDYQMALTLDHHFSQAYNNLGAVYHGKHQFDLAEKEYKRAIKYDPHSSVSYCNLGTTYFAEFKYKKGIKAYQKAIELDPQAFTPERRDRIEEGTPREARVATAYNLARVYASAGRNQEALAALRKAVDAGFKDRKRLMADKDFASLRETEEFRQLMVEEHLE
jgi:tetratricopeptide (TPR) repeat protein